MPTPRTAALRKEDHPYGYWAENPRYPAADWQQEVINGDTRRGYHDWVEACKEAEPHPDDPMVSGQRAAMFALYSEVFQTSESTHRHAFTAAVLGPDAPMSWSDNGGLTVGQADRLIGTLRFLTET